MHPCTSYLLAHPAIAQDVSDSEVCRFEPTQGVRTLGWGDDNVIRATAPRRRQPQCQALSCSLAIQRSFILRSHLRMQLD